MSRDSALCVLVVLWIDSWNDWWGETRALRNGEDGFCKKPDEDRYYFADICMYDICIYSFILFIYSHISHVVCIDQCLYNRFKAQWHTRVKQSAQKYRFQAKQAWSWHKVLLLPVKKGGRFDPSVRKKNNFWCKFALWTDPKKLQDEESGERHQSFAWLQHVSSKSLPPPFHPFFWGGWQLKYFLFPPRTLGKWSNLTQRSLNWLKPPSRKGWRWHQNTHLWPRERERERDDGWFDFDTQVLQL